MSATPDDDREAIDRAFAELVAGYHLTADRPDPPRWDLASPGQAAEPGSVFEPPRPELELPPELSSSEPTSGPTRGPEAVVEPAQEPEERYDPGPSPPLPRPTWPALIGWIGLGYAMVTVLAIAVGIDLPTWAAWAGVLGFVGGFGLLVSRLPRQRPPDAGDGAVL